VPLGACLEHVPETSGLRGTVGHIGAFSIDPEVHIQLAMVAATLHSSTPISLTSLSIPRSLPLREMAVEARGVLPFLHRTGARSLLDLQTHLHTRISRSTCAEELGSMDAAYTLGRVLASASWAVW